MKSILVLLSTYNGEKFLKEQLDSIFNQTGCNVRLLARDDGSSDNTVQILREYSNLYPEQIDIVEGNNFGWRKSFFKLLTMAKSKFSEFDYYAFADQDDIWMPNKLSTAIQKIETLPDGPNLYCSNLYYYKDGINEGKVRKKKSTPTYKNCLIVNHGTGCTEVFNNKLMKLVTSELPTIEVPHDSWLYQVAILCGNVYLDDDSYILYRQHANNQIGIRRTFLEVWKSRIQTIKDSLNDHFREKQASEIRRIFKSNLNTDSSKALNKAADYRKSFLSKIKFLLDNEYTTNKLSNDFWLKIRIIFSAF